MAFPLVLSLLPRKVERLKLQQAGNRQEQQESGTRGPCDFVKLPPSPYLLVSVFLRLVYKTAIRALLFGLWGLNRRYSLLFRLEGELSAIILVAQNAIKSQLLFSLSDLGRMGKLSWTTFKERTTRSLFPQPCDFSNSLYKSDLYHGIKMICTEI